MRDEASVDPTTCRAHVHAAGTRRGSPRTVDGEPSDHGLGASRGGWPTKIPPLSMQGAGRWPTCSARGRSRTAP